jgi:hypothetical protein
MPFSVETFRLSQAAVDKVKILLGHRDTLLRLLLEGVQDVDHFLKPHHVDVRQVSPCWSATISSADPPPNL